MTGLAHSLAGAAGLGAAARIGGVAALGALVAAVLAWIGHVADNPRPRPRNGLEKIPRIIVGIFAAILVVLVAVPAGFALLGVRPLVLTAPVGVIACAIGLHAGSAAIPGGMRPLIPVAIVLFAAELALVAAASTTSWPWLADLVLLAALLVAARQLSPRIRQRLYNRDG
jgi:hypothetical protein